MLLKRERVAECGPCHRLWCTEHPISYVEGSCTTPLLFSRNSSATVYTGLLSNRLVQEFKGHLRLGRKTKQTGLCNARKLDTLWKKAAWGSSKCGNAIECRFECVDAGGTRRAKPREQSSSYALHNIGLRMSAFSKCATALSGRLVSLAIRPSRNWPYAPLGTCSHNPCWCMFVCPCG
jgi:hypothetical protein